MTQLVPPAIPTNPTKQRHGCLTAWLILSIISNAFTALLYLINLAGSGNLGNIPVWALILLIILSAFNVICAILLFKWKKMGFWGFCISSVLVMIVNLALGLQVYLVLLGIVGVAVLYGVLQIGKENKGWPQLE